MEENRVSETLENILDAIDRICDGILSASAFALARTFYLIAQYDDTGYIEDGEDE